MKFVFNGKSVNIQPEVIRNWMSDKPKTLDRVDLSDQEQYEAVVDFIFSGNGEDFWTKNELKQLEVMGDREFEKYFNTES